MRLAPGPRIAAQHPGWAARPPGGLLVAVALLLSGCPAFTTMGPARTIPPGTAHLWVSAGAYRTTLVTSTPPAPVERSVIWLPLIETGARFGLSERVDLGLRAGTGGASIGPRIQVLRSPTEDSGVDLLFEPSIGWTGLILGQGSSTITGASLALAAPVGLNLGGGHQLVATPRLAAMRDDVAGAVTMTGGSLGLVLRLGETASGPWFLVPECGVASVQHAGERFEGPVWQCALGLIGPH